MLQLFGLGRRRDLHPKTGPAMCKKETRPMPDVFKKMITRYLDTEGRQVPKGTPGARKVREKSRNWYGRPSGAARPVPLCENKSAAQIMLNELEHKARLATVGLADP